jgi:signal peptidase I
MNELKYTVSILNSKWHPIKRNVEMVIIPRRDEYVYMNDQYYEVLNVVHMLNEKQDIFVIVNEMVKNINPQEPENQEIKK